MANTDDNWTPSIERAEQMAHEDQNQAEYDDGYATGYTYERAREQQGDHWPLPREDRPPRAWVNGFFAGQTARRGES
jgi:hypothetical protein